MTSLRYAQGNKELILKGFEVLAKRLNKSVEEVLDQVNERAATKCKSVVKQLIVDYNLDPTQIILVGGGGGAAAVVPYLAEKMNMKHKIAKNAETISPIGVALAMVRDIVERTISNPTDEEILSVRKEAEQAALKSGASPGTIEIIVEVDPRRNTVRAIATGATELRTNGRNK